MDQFDGNPLFSAAFFQTQQCQNTGAVHIEHPGQINPNGRGMSFGHGRLQIGKEAIRIGERDFPMKGKGQRVSSFRIRPKIVIRFRSHLPRDLSDFTEVIGASVSIR